MVSVDYGLRPVVTDGEEEKEVQDFNFDSLQEAFIKSDIEVGASSYWSELASIQTLDALFANDRITAIEYFERVPDGYIIDSDGLLKTRQEEMEQQLATEELPVEELPPAPQLTEEEMEQVAQWLELQPPEVQEQILALPPEQQEEAILQMMEQQDNVQ